MSEGWTTESVLRKHGLWRDLAGPLAEPTAIRLKYQEIQIERLTAERDALQARVAKLEKALENLMRVPAVSQTMNPSGQVHVGDCKCPWCAAYAVLVRRAAANQSEQQTFTPREE